MAESETPLWEDDFDFEEYEVQDVELDRENGRWIVSLEFGLRVQWPRGRGAPQPRKGQTLRMYGVADEETEPRGMVLYVKEDQPRAIFYRTEIEQQLHLIELEVRDEDLRWKTYESNREKIAERFCGLVRPFRERIEFLREQSKEPSEWWDAAYLEQEVKLSEHAMWAWKVRPEPTQLGIFLSLPNVQKLSSVFSMLREELTHKGDDSLAGVVFDPHLTPKEVDRVRLLATQLVDEESDQAAFNAIGVFRHRITIDQMIQNLPEEVRREALQESPD